MVRALSIFAVLLMSVSAICRTSCLLTPCAPTGPESCHHKQAPTTSRLCVDKIFSVSARIEIAAPAVVAANFVSADALIPVIDLDPAPPLQDLSPPVSLLVTLRI